MSPTLAAPQLLPGKTLAITGGATGIGRAIALGYIAHGANVVVNHLGDAASHAQFQSMLDEAARTLGSRDAAEARLVEVPGDVGEPETGMRIVEEVVRRWGRLDVFVSNAGVCEFKEFLEYVHPCCFCLRVHPQLRANGLAVCQDDAEPDVQC